MEATLKHFIIRVRPPSQYQPAEATYAVPDAHNISITNVGNTINYQFDGIYDQTVPTDQLFNQQAISYVQRACQGREATILTQGSTASGKTYTLFQPQSGLISLCLETIFQQLLGLVDRHIFVSAFEIYNEQVNNLGPQTCVNAQFKVIHKDGESWVPSLPETEINDAAQGIQFFAKSRLNTKSAYTHMNSQCGLSTMVYQIRIQNGLHSGSLRFVDLPGLQRAIFASKEKQQEIAHINKSLMALEQVVTAISKGQAHVPYKNSKVTELLRDIFLSLANHNLLVITCISMQAVYLKETLQQLLLATRFQSLNH